MARKIIDIGTVGNDGTGDSIRDSFRKVNDNFRELYSSLGLGERLKFIEMDDTPETYFGQENAILSVNSTTDGVQFKQIVGAVGVIVDYETNPNQIRLSTEFSAIVGDPNPQLGGNLSARSGGEQYRILDLATPVEDSEATNKAYVDTKISRAGVNAINPKTGLVTQSFGTMTGPLILARNPEDEDDSLYDGLIAATKRYVDNAGFASKVNLYVATSGQDERPGLSKAVQGRSLASAYRTIEAALKRAEELVNDSRLDIGPYKKVLTYQNGNKFATLEEISEAPGFGSGFQASVVMTVDQVTIKARGNFYQAGEIIELNGGGPIPAKIEILTTEATPGPISTFRILSGGSYNDLPPDSSDVTTIYETPNPLTKFGSGARFEVTYKVSNVVISNGGGGYSLVSVRVVGGGGSGAFGTAIINGGIIVGITIDDPGSGFTSIPGVVANLPRFLIKTEGLRTDFTGDVTTNTPESFRSRDIREGLFLKGETSGALAQILAHDGSLDSGGNEIFDVDIKFGSFIPGERIAYGDSTKTIQISVLIESGIYEENYPLKIPQNVAIIGDEFRRVLIKPKPGMSSSPWAFQKFRRDRVIDNLPVADRLFGYHYLTDSSQPVHPKINNPGGYKSAAALLELNKVFIQNEVIAWIDFQIRNEVPPFSRTFTYNAQLCRRDVGLIIDSIVFDLKYGGYNRTISAGLKYYEGVTSLGNSLIAITDQYSETEAGILKAKDLALSIITNTEVVPTFQDSFLQIIDPAFFGEQDADNVITDLVTSLIDVINPSGSGYNPPKNNDEMDVFLCNDANIIRAVTGQGHGGFMMVLDPEGQILAKSPYCQESASFSRSINAPTFAGGMFVDGFAGNLEFKILNKVDNFTLEVGELDRPPNLPCSFIIGSRTFRINYIRNFDYDPDGSTATFVFDETTPFTQDLFTYDTEVCRRDVGLILDGLGFDLVLGTNYNARKAGQTYRQANAEIVIKDQKNLTVSAIRFTHDLAKELLTAYPSQQQLVDSSSFTISEIVDKGTFFTPPLILNDPPGLSTNLSNAKTLLLANIDFIKDETIGYLQATYPSLNYNPNTCARDVGLILEALAYDLIYGGNSQTRDAGLKYYDGVGVLTALQIPANQLSETADAIDFVKDLSKLVIQNLAPAITYSSTSRITGTPASAAEANIIETLVSAISSIVTIGPTAAPAEVLPNTEAYSYDADSKLSRIIINTNRIDLQQEVIDFVDENANKYELIMPGNRSMLSNDFTQVCDLGYGLIATNGGLTEAVSMFTYYCHISYYSLNGGQIRSIAGSSAHGDYALVAEGADPLEVPTPVTLYQDLSQRVICYAPTPTFDNQAGGLFVFVTGYRYTPLGNSELEVDHGTVIFRYPVTSVGTEELPPGVARLNLTSDSTGNFDGLFAQIPDGTKMTLRANGTVILTGDVVEVATRPSTGLVLAESPDVYRILKFEQYIDPNGPYEVEFSNTVPTDISVLETIITIGFELDGTTPAANLCTTTKNHLLVTGNKFIPKSSANGLLEGVTYYVTGVPNYRQFYLSTVPNGSNEVLTSGTGLSIKGIVTHNLIEDYILSFDTTGSLPTGTGLGLLTGVNYFVLSSGLTDVRFRISDLIGGVPIGVTAPGSGVHSYTAEELAFTSLRENYNYNDLTVFSPGEFVTTPTTCTISIAAPAIVTTSGFMPVANNVIRFTSTGQLPVGITASRNYFVRNIISGNQFTISLAPGGVEVDTSGSQSGTQSFGLITGRAGDQNFAVVPVSPQDRARIPNSRFYFKGEPYVITLYESEDDLNVPYARITLDRPLVDSVIAYEAPYTIKSAIATRTAGAGGSLTIRISLTRVTGHDLLEIGTGSYADTNYPKEIFGPSVNSPNESRETEERDVGRVFYVTTDQFGNFRVGPFFAVDQGTGRVTFSAAIALSNLDGIGFKRGVPIAEFSVDSAFSDNAIDTVPTENATRIYIERRLGVSHTGAAVSGSLLIPQFTGGFLPLNGLLPMKGNIDMANFQVKQLADPTDGQDALNLRSLVFTNFQEFTITNLQANDLLVFTGTGNGAVNARIIGDLAFTLNPMNNTYNAQIQPDTIINADVKSDAAIAQSKLAMQAAGTLATAPGSFTQSSLGLTAFKQSEFDVTNGWVELKNNGFTLGKIEQIAGNHLLGNSTSGSANVTQVAFSTVIDNGNGVKKSQFGQNPYTGSSFTTGFLRRITAGTADSNFQTQEASSAASGYASSDARRLIERDASGNFGANFASLARLQLTAASSGGDTAIPAGTALARWNTSVSSGYIRIYGWQGAGGILIQDGTAAADKKTAYWNNSHEFRSLDGGADAPIKCSEVQTLSITTGGNTTAGTITGRWTLTGTSPNESRLQATYSADLAEYYEGDEEYEVGTVLVFGGDKEVTISSTLSDTRVAGVVSNTAAFVMYDACPGYKNLVALQGRVPCKVVGIIRKGDMLVTSDIPGVAIAVSGVAMVGTIIGKSLENYDSEEIGTIEIAVGRT